MLFPVLLKVTVASIYDIYIYAIYIIYMQYMSIIYMQYICICMLHTHTHMEALELSPLGYV